MLSVKEFNIVDEYSGYGRMWTNVSFINSLFIYFSIHFYQVRIRCVKSVLAKTRLLNRNVYLIK